MAKVVVTCTYCGEVWVETDNDWPRTNCPKCNDSQLKRKRVETTDGYGYDIKDPHFRKKRST